MNSEREQAEAQPDPLFSNTHWSLVLRAKDQSTTALNTLSETYRDPLMVWLRARQNEFHPLEADDLVNGFLSTKLREHFLKNVAPRKGKFRTFVLTCLQNYVTSEVRKLRAQIRGGDKPRLSIEETDEQGQAIIDPVSGDAGPDKQYDRAWAEAILQSAKYRLEAELAPKGHLPLWEALQPNLYGEAEARCYAQIAAQFGLTEAALCTAASRIRKRLRELLLEELRETVTCQEDFEEERQYFRELFGPSRGPASAA